MKIYTKGGDNGTTSLIGGERVKKCDLRVEAYGSVDELMAFVALLSDKLRGDEKVGEFSSQLDKINSRLMSVSALFAIGKGGEDKVKPLEPSATLELEEAIDSMQSKLPQITKFTIPGGDVRLSLAHVCRTVCRRSERAALRAAEEHKIDSEALRFLNRLSDYLYSLGRTITERLKVEEILWIP